MTYGRQEGDRLLPLPRPLRGAHLLRCRTPPPTRTPGRSPRRWCRGFLAGEFDLVQLVSTRFSAPASRPWRPTRSCPCRPSRWAYAGPRPGSNPPVVAGDGAADVRLRRHAGRGRGGRGDFEFEPPPEDLLALLVPRYAEAALYAALLEASASEHIARQRAMSAATENADELIKNLRRVMNRARQDTITSEIMEIVGGAEALRQGRARAARPGLQRRGAKRMTMTDTPTWSSSSRTGESSPSQAPSSTSSSRPTPCPRSTS